MALSSPLHVARACSPTQHCCAAPQSPNTTHAAMTLQDPCRHGPPRSCSTLLHRRHRPTPRGSHTRLRYRHTPSFPLTVEVLMLAISSHPLPTLPSLLTSQHDELISRGRVCLQRRGWVRRLNKGTTWQLARASVSLWHGRVSAAGGIAAWLWHHTDDVVHASTGWQSKRSGEWSSHTGEVCTRKGQGKDNVVWGRGWNMTVQQYSFTKLSVQFARTVTLMRT
jgi:hypothetical protein